MKYNFLTEQFPKTLFFVSLLVLLILIPFDEGGNGNILQLITQLLALICATVWAAQKIRCGKLTLIFDRLDVVVLGGLVWLLLSLAVSDYKYATILELIKISSYAALFYLCRLLFPLRKKRTILLMVILGSGVFQCFVAWTYYLTGRTEVLKAGFVNPNNFACFLLFGIHIALSFLLFFRDPTGQFSKKQVYLRKILISVSLAFLLITLLAIQSRGAMVSLAGTGIVLTTLRKKKLGAIFVILCCLMIFLPTPWGSIFQRLQKRDDAFAYQRLDIWTNSARMAIDHPVIGVGLGMFKYYGLAYNFPIEHRIARYGKILNSPHSDYLQTASELGVVGLFLFLGGIGITGYYSWRRLRKYPRSWQDAAAFAGILGVLIQGLFSTLLRSPALALVPVILSAILLDRAKIYRRKDVTFSASWQWYVALFLVCIYILIPVICYPFLAHVHYLKYGELRQKKDYANAVTHLKTAIEYVPIHALYHSTLGGLYLAAFRNSPNLDAFYEGYTSLTEAVRHNPREHQAYKRLAELHRAMFYQKLKTTPAAKPTAQNALKAYQQALQNHPFDVFSMFSMAMLYADIEEFDKAIELLRKSVTIEPNFVTGHQMLGKLLSHVGQKTESADAFRQAEKILQYYSGLRERSPYEQLLLRPVQ